MLPTLVFILWAYGMYALLRNFSRRKGGHLRSRNRVGRYLALATAGLVGVGLGILVWFSFAPEQSDHRLKLAGFLGTVYAEGMPGKMERRGEDPPLKAQAPGDQPVYAMLHPEAPPTATVAPPEKAHPLKPQRKAKLRNPPANPEKASKVAKSTAAKKERTAGKKKMKKKKTAATAGSQPGAGTKTSSVKPAASSKPPS